MLTSITPLGERGRQRRWGVTVTVYAVSSAISGLTLGALLGSLPDLPSRTALVVLGAACLGAAGLDLAPTLLPTVRRQVNEDWLPAYRGWVCGAGYGAQLGLGVVTIVTTAGVYATLVGAAVAGPWWAGALVGLTFGLVRALPALLVHRVRTTEALVALSRRLAAWAGPARRATITALALAGAVALAGAA